MSRRLVLIARVPGPSVVSRTIEGRPLTQLTAMFGLPHVREVQRRYDAVYLIPSLDPSGVHVGKRTLAQAASEMLPSLVGAPTILLGTDVSLAFGVCPRPYAEWREVSVDVGTRTRARFIFAVVPSPSSVNRTLNDRATMGIVCNFLRRVRDEEASGVLYERVEAAADEYARSLLRGERDSLLTPDEAATILGVTRRTLDDAVRNRRIGYLRLAADSKGHGVRFRHDHLAAFERATEVPAEVVLAPRPALRHFRIPPDVGEPRGYTDRRGRRRVA